MDTTALLEIFKALDPGVMASVAVIAGLLRHSPRTPIWLAIVVPLVIGGAWGALVVDTITAREVFSSVLLNGAGAVVIGRLAYPVVKKLFEFDNGPPPTP